MTHVGVVGSRSFDDFDLMCRHLKFYVSSNSIIVSGGAKGADSLAREYAQLYGIQIVEIYPDYKTHGPSAPFIRNGQIVDRSDFIVAFWDGQSKGTLDTINKAKRQQKRVFKILYKDFENLLTI